MFSRGAPSSGLSGEDGGEAGDEKNSGSRRGGNGDLRGNDRFLLGSKFMQKLLKLGPQFLLHSLYLVCHEGDNILHTPTTMTFCFTTVPESVMPRTVLGLGNLENTGRASSSSSSLKSFCLRQDLML